LAGIVLDATEKDKSDGRAFPCNGIKDILFPKSVFTRPRGNFQDNFRGIETMGKGL
jgi:hypothetical protein